MKTTRLLLILSLLVAALPASGTGMPFGIPAIDRESAYARFSGDPVIWANYQVDSSISLFRECGNGKAIFLKTETELRDSLMFMDLETGQMISESIHAVEIAENSLYAMAVRVYEGKKYRDLWHLFSKDGLKRVTIDGLTDDDLSVSHWFRHEDGVAIVNRNKAQGFDAGLGKRLFSSTLEGVGINQVFDSCRLAGDRLLTIDNSVGKDSALLACFELKTGKRIWSTRLVENPENDLENNFYFVQRRMVIEGNKYYEKDGKLTVFSNNNLEESNVSGNAYTVDMSTGKLLGKLETIQFESIEKTEATIGGRYKISLSGNVVAGTDGKTGKKVFSHTVSGGRVITETVRMANIDNMAVIAEGFEAKLFHGYNLTTGKLVWKYTGNYFLAIDFEKTSRLFVRGDFENGTEDLTKGILDYHHIYMIEPQSGKILYKFNLGDYNEYFFSIYDFSGRMLEADPEDQKKLVVFDLVNLTTINPGTGANVRLINEDKIIFHEDTEKGNKYSCYNTKNGETLWSVYRDYVFRNIGNCQNEQIGSFVYMGQLYKGRFCLFDNDGEIAIFDMETGKSLTVFATERPADYSANPCNIIVSGNLIVSFGEGIVGFDRNKFDEMLAREFGQ